MEIQAKDHDPQEEKAGVGGVLEEDYWCTLGLRSKVVLGKMPVLHRCLNAWTDGTGASKHGQTEQEPSMHGLIEQGVSMHGLIEYGVSMHGHIEWGSQCMG